MVRLAESLLEGRTKLLVTVKCIKTVANVDFIGVPWSVVKRTIGIVPASTIFLAWHTITHFLPGDGKRAMGRQLSSSGHTILSWRDVNP